MVLRVTDPEAGQLVGNLRTLTDEIQIQVHLKKAPVLQILYMQIFFIKTPFMDYFAYRGNVPLLRLYNGESYHLRQQRAEVAELLEYLKLLTL